MTNWWPDADARRAFDAAARTGRSGRVARPDAPPAPVARPRAGLWLDWSWGHADDNNSNVTGWELQHKLAGQDWDADGVTLLVAVALASHRVAGIGTDVEARVRMVASDGGASPWSGTGTLAKEALIAVDPVLPVLPANTPAWPYRFVNSAAVYIPDAAGSHSSSSLTRVFSRTIRIGSQSVASASSSLASGGSSYLLRSVLRIVTGIAFGDAISFTEQVGQTSAGVNGSWARSPSPQIYPIR